MSLKSHAFAFLALAAVPSLAAASSLGANDGFAGNPPFENDCTICHFGNDVNSGDGSMELVGLPTDYVPGQTYPLELMLEDPDQMRWGFQLTVLDVDDVLAQGGQLAVTDAVNTQISLDSEGTEDYLKQTLDGTYEGVADGPVSWTFEWTAPGPELNGVTLYVAGNAANGDFSLTGDYIYTSQITMEPAGPTPVEETTWGGIKSLYASER